MKADFSQSHQTALKTFRLPTELIKVLEEEASDEGTSLSSLVLANLTRHAEWDAKAKKLGEVGISRTLLEGLLASADEKELLRFSRTDYATSWLDRVMFFYQDTSLERMLTFLELTGRHQGVLDVNVRKTGKDYSVSMHHELGPKFSLIIENTLDTVWRTQYHIQPIFRTGKSTVTMEFSVP